MGEGRKVQKEYGHCGGGRSRKDIFIIEEQIERIKIKLSQRGSYLLIKFKIISTETMFQWKQVESLMKLHFQNS